MTALTPTLRERSAQWLLYLAVPLLALAFQLTAKKAALGMAGQPFGVSWLLAAATHPWVWAMILFEVIGLVVWMVVLAEIKLSEAFPSSALAYVLVIATSWIVFHEPHSPLQIVGGACILTGAWLIGRFGEDEA